MKALVKFPKEIFNKVYLPLLKDKKRYVVLYGSAGSGKSIFIAQKIITAMLQYEGLKVLLLRKVSKTIRRSQYQLIKDLINDYKLKNLFELVESDLVIKCRNGNELISAGLDDVEKLKSITGIGLIWIEEATELKGSDFEQVDLRLRGNYKFPKQIFLSFNPISQFNWAVKRFVYGVDKKATVLLTTYKDNRFIDKEYKQILEGLKDRDENMYNIYALGIPGVLKNIIYYPFKVINEYPLYYNQTFYGLDFGFNNPTALVEVNERDKEYYLNELIYERGLTNSDLIERLKEVIPEDKRRKNPIYADSAEPARIEEIERAGFLIYPAEKNVRDGIDYVKRQKIYSNPNNKNINEEVNNYRYMEDKNGKVLEEPVKEFDHVLDGIRYSLFTNHLHSNSVDMEVW